MSNEPEAIQPLSPEEQDELFAERAIETAAQAGVYVEVNRMFDADLDCTVYYAMTMNAEEHAQMAATVRTDAVSQPTLVAKDAPAMLPWTVFIEQPTFVTGYKTSRDALVASGAKYQELQRRLSTIRPPRNIDTIRKTWGKPL